VVIAVHLLIDDTASLDTSAMAPHLEFTAPTFSPGAVVGIALPLYVVTMASQNLPGVAVLKTFGYETPWKDALVTTGVGSLLVAPAGGSAINLAAISAALSADPATGVAKELRWRNAVWSGSTYLVLAVSAAAIVALAASAPVGLLAAVAGVALLGAFGGAVQGAWSDESLRLPAIMTFLVAASGTTFFGIGAAFWALVAGVGVAGVQRFSAAGSRRR
jgi:benzoate membrane transport protein